MREAMQLVLQALIGLVATEKIGAARYERTDHRSTHRNGSRSRLLSTKAGDVELAIPKLRHGSFFLALLEPRRRIDRALWAVIMEAFVHGSALARSTTWWPPWASMRACPRARCLASAPSSTGRSPSSGSDGSTLARRPYSDPGCGWNRRFGASALRPTSG